MTDAQQQRQPLDKPTARRYWRQRRDSMAQAQRSASDRYIAYQLSRFDKVVTAPVLLAYASFGSEVGTWRVIEQHFTDAAGSLDFEFSADLVQSPIPDAVFNPDQRLILPRCLSATSTLAWYEVDSLGQLTPGPFGILEPLPDDARCFDPASVAGAAEAAVLVPGIAFDKQGYRLGYGKGYYDRFLSGFAGVTVGICRECTLSGEALPHDGHDMRVDYVVTELQVLDTATGEVFQNDMKSLFKDR